MDSKMMMYLLQCCQGLKKNDPNVPNLVLSSIKEKFYKMYQLQYCHGLKKVAQSIFSFMLL